MKKNVKSILIAALSAVALTVGTISYINKDKLSGVENLLGFLTDYKYTDTVYITKPYQLDSMMGESVSGKLLLIKGGLYYNGKLTFVGDNFAISSYDTEETGLPVLDCRDCYMSHTIRVIGSNIYLGDLKVLAQDSVFNLGNGGQTPVKADVNKVNGKIWINNIETYGGLRSMAIGARGKISGSQIYISNSYLNHCAFDGIYGAYLDKLIVENTKVDSSNLNWQQNIGGDNSQTEIIDTVIFKNCELDHSAVGGKFAYISNGAWYVEIWNTLFKGHSGGSVVYGGGVPGEDTWRFFNCIFTNGARGYWQHADTTYFVNCLFYGLERAVDVIKTTYFENCTFYDLDMLHDGWASDINAVNCLFVDIPRFTPTVNPSDDIQDYENCVFWNTNESYGEVIRPNLDPLNLFNNDLDVGSNIDTSIFGYNPSGIFASIPDKDTIIIIEEPKDTVIVEEPKNNDTDTIYIRDTIYITHEIYIVDTVLKTQIEYVYDTVVEIKEVNPCENFDFTIETVNYPNEILLKESSTDVDVKYIYNEGNVIGINKGGCVKIKEIKKN